jgi:hypothetical protein
MIGTSGAEYIFIRACILFLHNIVSASILYCALLVLCLLHPSCNVYRAPALIETWLIAESLFFFAIFIPYRRHLQRPAVHPERLPPEERAKLFERCTASVQDPESYLSLWHLGAKKEDIKRENVKELFRWAFLNSGDAREEDEPELEEYAEETEKLLGRRLPPGKGSAKSLRLTLDEVDFLHRSLLWYLVRGPGTFLGE